MINALGSRAGLLLLLVFLGSLWGTTISLSKIAVSTGYQPFGLIFWQLAFSAILLGVYVAVRRMPIPLGRAYLRHYLVVGVLGTVLPNSLAYLAIARVPVGIMAIVIASVPMFALMFALTFRLEKLALRRAVGIILGGLAVIVLVAPQAGLPDNVEVIFVLIALCAPACYGLEGCYLVVYTPNKADPAVTLFGASVIGAILAAPLAWSTGGWIDLTIPWHAPEWALLISAGLHVVAYTGYITLVNRAGVVFASQISYVVTLSGVSISVIVLGETHSHWVWLALGLMIAGLALVRPSAGSTLRSDG